MTHNDGLVQERRDSIANALESRFSCTNPSIYSMSLGHGYQIISTQNCGIQLRIHAITRMTIKYAHYLFFSLWLCYQFLHSLDPSDAIWRQKTGSTLTQVMACCWRHQAIIWTNVDLLSIRSSHILLRAISLQVSHPSITLIGLKSTHLKFH